MDLPSLENYPMYILNVVPEFPEENVVQCPQQITSSESLSYNFFVPNVDHHVPLSNTQSVSSIVSLKNKTKSIKKNKKQVQIKAGYNQQQLDSNRNTYSEKPVIDLSSLLKDEDIQSTNKEVLKYDPVTDTNVIFHLVRPSDLEVNPVEIKVPKRGRPRKDVIESNKSKTEQDNSSKQFKPENVIEYPLISTKSGRVCKPPKNLLNGEKTTEMKKGSYLILKNDDILGRKKVKYNIKSDFVCGGCGKTYLGHKRMQEHLEKFPTHKMNTTEQVDSEIQNIFQNLHETPTNIDLITNKKETHTQTEVLKNRHCGYMKTKKNLSFHLKQIMKHLKKSNLLKSLSGTISIWDLLSSTLENGNIQAFSKELNTLIINLKNASKSFKFISECESNSIDNDQMFIDDSLGCLFGLPKGTYSFQNIQNEYEIENEPNNIWTLNSTKIVESKVSTPQNLNHHSSPIHLNLFDSQSSKVDFLLSSSMEESIMCEANQAALESVDGLVSERLRTMTDHLHSTVPIIDYPIVSTSSSSNVQSDSFMGHGVYEVFTNELNLVPTSTEEFIKSLEQFEPLNDSDNTLNTETRMLDFEDLRHTFHTT